MNSSQEHPCQSKHAGCSLQSIEEQALDKLIKKLLTQTKKSYAKTTNVSNFHLGEQKARTS